MKFIIPLLVGLLVTPLVAATDVGIQNCWMAWEPSTTPGVVAYHVKLSPTAGGPYTLRDTRLDIASIQVTTTTPVEMFVDCTTGGLLVSEVTAAFLDYHMVVTAENIVGDESGPSNEALARLHVPPGQPGNARITRTRP